MTESATSTLDRRNNRAYFKELGGSMLAYVVLLVVALTLFDEARSDAVNLAVMLLPVLPVLPAIGIAWACVRMLQRSDEFVRSRQLEAIAIGFVLAMLASVTLGFLTNVVTIPGVPWIVYGIGMAGWAFGAIVRGRR